MLFNIDCTEATTGDADAGPTRRVQIFNASDSFSPDDSRQLAVFAKPENSKQFLRNAISAHYLFDSLEEDDLNRIIDCMRPTFAAVNEVIIRQGELGDLFFCLETGTATAAVDGKVVVSYEAGGCFGELALIYNSPRAASVVATAACKLWTLDLRYASHFFKATLQFLDLTHSSLLCCD